MDFSDVTIFKMKKYKPSIWYKMDFIFNHTEKIIDTIIVELDEFKLSV